MGANRKKQRELRDAGIAKISQQDYEGARKDFNAALGYSGGRITDAEVDICYYIGACFVMEGRLDDAISRYSDLITYDSGNADAYFLRGSTYLDADEPKKGISDYNTSIDLRPKDYERYLAICQNLVALGYEDEAQGILTRALEIEGDDADQFYYRGRIYLMLGQTDLAKTALIRAMDDGNEQAGIYLAQTFLDDGDLESARDLISRYTDKEDPDAGQSVLTGRLLLETGKYKKAQKIYEDALKDNNGEYDKELMRGWIAALEYNGDFDKAYEVASDYISKYPSDASMLRELSFLETRAAKKTNDKE